MPRISQVNWPRMKINYGYLFDIQTEEELHDYWCFGRTADLKDGLSKYLCSSEYQQATGQGPGRGHCVGSGAGLLAMAVRCEQEKETERRSVVQVWADINDTIYQGMRKTLQETGRIFIGKNGGYFNAPEDLSIIDTHTINTYALPGSKLSITQWPNGSHWYAKVGNAEVEMYGARKWDSYDEAKNIAHKWAKEHSMTIDET